MEAARTRAPHARVVLVDYLTVLGEATTPAASTLADLDQVLAFRRLGEQLDTAFAEAAARTGADLVRASALSVDHVLGSAEPWVTGFRPLMKPVPFHPNARGMRAVADAVHSHVTA